MTVPSADNATAATQHGRPLLALDGLSKQYGGLIAVNDVTLRVAAGEVRAVIGPNGAGKTTLFHTITGVVRPTAGTVHFDGEDITGLPAHVICQKGLSRTFQITSLFPAMSARENVMLAAQARNPKRWSAWGGGAIFGRARIEADAALEQLGLTAIASRPAGLLSHGDQRLLEVAMALAQSPKVLLLDEPRQGRSGRGRVAARRKHRHARQGGRLDAPAPPCPVEHRPPSGRLLPPRQPVVGAGSFQGIEPVHVSPKRRLLRIDGRQGVGHQGQRVRVVERIGLLRE